MIKSKSTEKQIVATNADFIGLVKRRRQEGSNAGIFKEATKADTT